MQRTCTGILSSSSPCRISFVSVRTSRSVSHSDRAPNHTQQYYQRHDDLLPQQWWRSFTNLTRAHRQQQNQGGQVSTKQQHQQQQRHQSQQQQQQQQTQPQDVTTVHSDKQQHRAFVENVGTKLGVRKWEDWYEVTNDRFCQFPGASDLLYYYCNSMHLMLQTVYPQHHWLPWLFARVPVGFWDNMDNQREALEWLGKQMKFSKMEDYYNLTIVDVKSHRLGGLLMWMYRGSVYAMLSAVFADYEWLPWRFLRISDKKFWESSTNQLRALEWLGERVGVRTWEDWYHVTVDQVHAQGCGGLLFHTHKSLPELLTSLYPQYPWVVWNFGPVRKELWSHKQHQRVALQTLEEKLNIGAEKEKWYHVTVEMVCEAGGHSLLLQYETSVMLMLLSVCPEYGLLPWKFHKISTGFWDQQNHVRQYFDWLIASHDLAGPENLVQKPKAFFLANFGGSLLRQYSVDTALKLAYPDLITQRGKRVSWLHASNSNSNTVTAAAIVS